MFILGRRTTRVISIVHQHTPHEDKEIRGNLVLVENDISISLVIVFSSEMDCSMASITCCAAMAFI
jgi:hypothetical protein